ncbi:hypothetical protein [Paenibacillus sp. Marseille-Q7038]
MNKMFVSRKVGYPKYEVDVLERASLQVQSIYDRAATMAKHYYLSLDLSYPNALQQVSRTYFQKWIYTIKGWKFIGSEYTPESTENDSTITPLMSLCLQALIWSQYEEIRLLHPFLGEESFYSEEELDIIAAYFVPTYFSERPLRTCGKPYRKRNLSIPIYQENLRTSSLVYSGESEMIEERLTTGVYISDRQFKGLGPYIKNRSGTRIFMQAAVE